jgi:hypothetical protein
MMNVIGDIVIFSVNCNQIMSILLPYFVFILNPINRNIWIVDKQVNEHNVILKANS